jgi:hypothetical protein
MGENIGDIFMAAFLGAFWGLEPHTACLPRASPCYCKTSRVCSLERKTEDGLDSMIL